MIKGLGNKNYWFVLICILLMLICYQFAFKMTIDAVQLNRRLKANTDPENSIIYNPDYLKKKESVLNRLSGRYSADSLLWKDEFWMEVSKLAIMHGINIHYGPSKISFPEDSSSHLLKLQMRFEGRFRDLVSLIDTIEKDEKAGFIQSLEFKKVTEGPAGAVERIFLNTRFAIIKN